MPGLISLEGTFKVKSRIGIRIKVMRIRYPVLNYSKKI